MGESFGHKIGEQFRSKVEVIFILISIRGGFRSIMILILGEISGPNGVIHGVLYGNGV